MAKTPVIFGEVLFDCFEDGSRVLGGAPFNVAWHLQAFGCEPLFISRVGDDPMGRQIRDTMLHWGMNAAGLQLDSAHPTGEVQVSLRDGQPRFEILPDRAYDHIDAGAMPPLSPSLIYHGSLALRQAGSSDALAQLLQQHPSPVFMDVNLRSPWWNREQLGQLLDHAQWVKINDDELSTLVNGPGDLLARARILLERHDLTSIIVTQGAKGAFAIDKAGNHFAVAPAAQVPVVDTVGAGDAFAAVCILGLTRDWPLILTLEQAQRFAAMLVQQRGATINDPASYQSLRVDWQLTQ